ncbi:MAG: hypothetical protein AABX70_03890 [Nanoarchaeota archaeon]
MHKIREWYSRYSWPELVGIIVTLIVSNFTLFFSQSILFSAYAAAWADSIAFYGIIAWRDYRQRKDNSVAGFFKLLRNMIMEFGPAE